MTGAQVKLLGDKNLNDELDDEDNEIMDDAASKK